jgi:methylenetetrahydrofolate--tRNA-(uracil-5-)-methyltransferase
MSSETKSVTIIGGGLAGSEAASFLLKRGYTVELYERRPLIQDGAHETADFGELVCSNSLKSKRLDNACGLLKEELRKMDSIMMRASALSEVPGGNALAVDRNLFSAAITQELSSYSTLHVHREDVSVLPSEGILATGPLTSPGLLASLGDLIGTKNLSFFDASAPIVSKASIDFSKAYFKSRFEQGDSAYINCPLSQEEYVHFVTELLAAQKTLLHEFDTHYFEGCLPLEVMAARGLETLRHGPLKPFGLETPEHPHPYAVTQLRQDSKLGDYYNLVGFQTNLTYPEQKRVFSLIPGLEHAEFFRYGLMHRNAYLDAPKCLSSDLSLQKAPGLFVAGQLSGVEGYVESAAMGLVAGINFARKKEGRKALEVPKSTVTGALIDYLLHASASYFQPMNANWALLPTSQDTREETIVKSLEAIESYWKSVHE